MTRVSNPGFTPQKDEWNAAVDGNYLWSSVNFGEAVTEAMTPLTWSVIRFTLGIPAVVGCGDATARLKTGDRVLVDGGAGTVTVMRKA